MRFFEYTLTAVEEMPPLSNTRAQDHAEMLLEVLDNGASEDLPALEQRVCFAPFVSRAVPRHRKRSALARPRRAMTGQRR